MRSTWNSDQWKVLSSDKSKFEIFGSKQRQYVYEEEVGKSYKNPVYIQQ